jgi:histidine phosphotransferase ChpT
MIDPARLSAYIASRICHDLVSPVSSVTNALDFMKEPGDADMQAQAEELLQDGADKAAARIQFLRYAYGSIGLSSGAADVHEAKAITENFVKGYRPSLEWDMETSHLSYSHVRLLMNMVTIALDCLPRGGVINIRVRDEAGGMTLTLTGKGERAKLKDATIKALAGEEPEENWGPETIQPYFAKMIADGLGGALTANLNDDTVIIMAAGVRAEG